MKAKITQAGMVYFYDGHKWEGEEPLRTHCEMLESLLPLDYYPDPMRGISARVKELLPAPVACEIVGVAEPELEDDTLDPNDVQY